MAEHAKIIIIGGGVTGLCAAHLLAEKVGRDSVLVLEGSEGVGGQTQTEVVDGFVCDRGPNGFLDKEAKTLEWVEALGIEMNLVRANEAAARRFIVRHGKLVEVVGPPGFLVSPLLSVRGRARLLCEPLVRAKKNSAEESVWDFAARRIGREAADTLVTPMVSGVFGGDAKALSLGHCFPRMAEMEAKYGGLYKALRAKRKEDSSASPMGPSGTLTSFRNGIGTLPQRAADKLGPQHRGGVKVTSITRRGGGYVIETENGGTFEAEKVVVALPAYAAAEVTATLDDELSKTLRRIPYSSITVLCTGYKRADVGHALDGFGFLIPRTEGKRVLGCIWTSSLFSGRTPDGYVMLRTMIGGATDGEAVGLSDNELLGYVESEIHPLLSMSRRPEFVRIYRWNRGIPQYNLGHGAILEGLETAEGRLPGFALAGNAYRGVGLNDCVLSAHRAVARLL